jgi:hypothetical protein
MVLEITRRQSAPLPSPFDGLAAEPHLFVVSRSDEATKNFAVEEKSAKRKLEKRKGQRNRSTPTSAWGPPSWKEIPAKHREVLTIPLDPPGNGTDVTQNGKRRQCVCAGLSLCVSARLQGATPSRTSGASADISGYEANDRECNNLLARGVGCGRLASVCSPAAVIPGVFWHFHSGAGRESFSGGRAAWASFFSSSSG